MVKLVASARFIGHKPRYWLEQSTEKAKNVLQLFLQRANSPDF